MPTVWGSTTSPSSTSSAAADEGNHRWLRGVIDDVDRPEGIELIRRSQAGDPAADLQPWLFKIVTNTARNHLRSRGRRAALALRVASLSATIVPEPELPHDALLRAFNRLDRRDRLILALRYFDDLSERQMATALSTRPGTIKSRLNRALGRLRAELRRGGIDA